MNAKIILINGTSSAGKSSLCQALQNTLDEPFWYLASDQFIDIGMAPSRKDRGGTFDWGELRPTFFKGFHRTLPAFASAGNNLIIEHVIEAQSWMDELVWLLHEFDVFFIGLHCPLDVIEQRERERGNRRIGEARYHMKTHTYCKYDFEVDCQRDIPKNVDAIINAWRQRAPYNAFYQLYQAKFGSQA